MPVEIESFTTEVTLAEPGGKLSPQQIELLIQEILRRLQRKQREDDQAERNASFNDQRK